MIYDNSNIPAVFSQTIQLASTCHSYNTRFADKQNFSRSKVRTNYGVHTFNFVSSEVWQSIDPEIKLSCQIQLIFSGKNTSSLYFFHKKRHK